VHVTFRPARNDIARVNICKPKRGFATLAGGKLLTAAPLFSR
jgi:hypothetical protein